MIRLNKAKVVGVRIQQSILTKGIMSGKTSWWKKHNEERGWRDWIMQGLFGNV